MFKQMFKQIKKIDTFGKNIILVLLGTSLLNFFSLLYQLLIAHSLSPSDFAAFNSLLSIYMLVSSTLGTLNVAVTKYTAEFNAHGQQKKIQALLSLLLRKTFFLAAITFVILILFSPILTKSLKIDSLNSGYILAAMISLSWIIPVLLGILQGLELFKWYTSVSVISALLKLGLAFWFIKLGFNIAGSLGAFLFSSLAIIAISFLPLMRIFPSKAISEPINFKEIFLYLLPVGISFFCFNALVTSDMVLVKYFFMPEESGFYSLAQMVGKIFLFLPAAISIVLLPRSSSLKAKKFSTGSSLERSLSYAAILCILAVLFYNIFPSLVLNILTGKVFSESLVLGRMFSISMSFFALLYIFINYFLSIKDLRFIKYLVLSTFLQCLAIIIFHRSLQDIQFILCINSILLFLVHFSLFKQIPKEAF